MKIIPQVFLDTSFRERNEDNTTVFLGTSFRERNEDNTTGVSRYLLQGEK